MTPQLDVSRGIAGLGVPDGSSRHWRPIWWVLGAHWAVSRSSSSSTVAGSLQGASVPRDPGRNHKFTRRPCLSSHTVSLLLHSVAQEQVMGPDSRRRGCTKHEPQEVWLMGAVFGDELP